MIKLENRSNGRYYYLHVQRDMFGDVVLILIRGGMKLHLQPRTILCDKINEIERRIEKIIRLKSRRGYTITN